MLPIAILIAGVTACLALPSFAFAQEPPTTTPVAEPPGSLLWKDTSVFRWNPLGLLTAAELEYRYRLYESDHPLFEQNYVSLAATPIVTPAFTRLGARLELMPLTAARFGVQYEFIQFFGILDYFQSFDDPLDPVDEDTLEANADVEGLDYATNGTQLSMTGMLQGKVGPIAARNKYLLARVDFDVREGDTVFYDPFYDLLLPAQGWMWTNELDLLYIGERLIAGLRWTSLRSYLPGVEGEEDPNNPIHRLGPLVVYRFAGDGEGLVTGVSALGLFQWYLAHRYRTGQESSQAVPYIGVGIIVEGRIL